MSRSNFSRRAVLSGAASTIPALAIGGLAVAAPAAIQPANIGAHPDAELLRLGDELANALARREEESLRTSEEYYARQDQYEKHLRAWMSKEFRKAGLKRPKGFWKHPGREYWGPWTVKRYREAQARAEEISGMEAFRSERERFNLERIRSGAKDGPELVAEEILTHEPRTLEGVVVISKAVAVAGLAPMMGHQRIEAALQRLAAA